MVIYLEEDDSHRLGLVAHDLAGLAAASNIAIAIGWDGSSHSRTPVHRVYKR